jgi:hypothetical protein
MFHLSREYDERAAPKLLSLGNRFVRDVKRAAKHVRAARLVA